MDERFSGDTHPDITVDVHTINGVREVWLVVGDSRAYVGNDRTGIFAPSPRITEALRIAASMGTDRLTLHGSASAIP